MTFGRDLWCYDRVYTGRIATGAEVVAQALFRRLNTARGTLRDGEEGAVYGLDILDFVGQVGSENAVDALPPLVEMECLKDDRVKTCKVDASVVRGTDGLVTVLLDVHVDLHDEEDSFALSLSVNDVTVALLGTVINP